MRLINTTDFRLKNFVADIPSYVILSHMWAQDPDEEVLFSEIQDLETAKQKPGWFKIEKCCFQAKKDGYEWAWVDTCCIDKTSSAELSEAINSMYKWYWEAEICYAYLADVPDNIGDVEWVDDFKNSRWFERGWTLQELLAPVVVEFYGSEWISRLGTKSSLAKMIESITKISQPCLRNRMVIQAQSIATKFHWASLRQTTREEDIAYCLLGLVGVHMPMLYGEGQRAFYRLQLEILQQSEDQTIFAWGGFPAEPLDEFFAYSRDHPERPQLGILAVSPRWFTCPLSTCYFPEKSYRSTPSRRGHKDERESAPHKITSRGIKMTVPCISVSTFEGSSLVLVLRVANPNKKGEFLGININENLDLYAKDYPELVDSETIPSYGTINFSRSRWAFAGIDDSTMRSRARTRTLYLQADDTEPAPSLPPPWEAIIKDINFLCTCTQRSEIKEIEIMDPFNRKLTVDEAIGTSMSNPYIIPITVKLTNAVFDIYFKYTTTPYILISDSGQEVVSYDDLNPGDWIEENINPGITVQVLAKKIRNKEESTTWELTINILCEGE